MSRLCSAGGTQAPALALAAVVHAEIAVTQPFDWGSGLIARAMTRLVLRAKGVDPDGWSVPEAGLRMLGRPAYVSGLRGYASGEPDGVTGWLILHSQAVAAGARAAASWSMTCRRTDQAARSKEPGSTIGRVGPQLGRSVNWV